MRWADLIGSVADLIAVALVVLPSDLRVVEWEGVSMKKLRLIFEIGISISLVGCITSENKQTTVQQSEMEEHFNSKNVRSMSTCRPEELDTDCLKRYFNG